eukprot:9862470-Ditylum_brightwellii.AAC.1
MSWTATFTSKNYVASMSPLDMTAARYLWLHDSLAIIDSSCYNIANIACGIQGHWMECLS